MRVAALTARDIQNSRTDRELEHLEQSRYFAPITFGSKKRLVLEEIVGVERGFPPLAPFSQKNTGSR